MAALTAACCGTVARRGHPRRAAPVARSTAARCAGAFTACILAALVRPLTAAERPVATTGIIRVEPVDTGEPLANPGMGWVLYHYDHHLSRYGSRLAPSDTVDDFPGVSVVSMAVPWRFLEPREGVYDWAVIDTPARPFRASWANVGVAACHPGGWPAVTLEDRQGGIVAVLVAEDFPVGTLPPAPSGDPRPVPQESRFRLPAVPRIEPGTYDLFVSVGRPDGTPVIALPLPGHDGHRRYRLGGIAVTAEPGDARRE